MKENTVDIYLFGKKYTVPDDLTIMRAMEYVLIFRRKPFSLA